MGLAVGLACVTAAGGKLQGQRSDQDLLPDDEGKDVVIHMCQSCHPMETITTPRYSEARWASVVDDMIAFGVQGSEEDIETVIRYLAKHFGPEKTREAGTKSPPLPKVNVNKAGVPELAAVLQLSVQDARAIVSYREENGKFKNWQDLKEVPGLDKKIEQKKELLAF
jgi:competence ComEA-like helix-hairpin-helix protein